MWRAVFNLVEDVKHLFLTFGLAFVFVDVRHYLLDLLERFNEVSVVAVGLGRVFENVVEQKADAGKALDGSDHEFLQRLPATLGLRLIHLEEGLEARLGLSALHKRGLH